MKNKLFIIFIVLFFNFVFFKALAAESFNFDVTEIQVLENGNKFVGTKRGTITSSNGIIIKADQFEYDKKLNILNANGNVEIEDKINKYLITTRNIIYEKQKEIIYTKGNSKALSLTDDIIISSENFNYDREKNIIIAKKNVILENLKEDYKINSDFISYFLTEDKIFSKGKTTGLIKSNYNFESKNVTFLKNSMELFSKEVASFTDKNNFYRLSNFIYSLKKEVLKGEKILIKSNYKLPKSDEFYFSSAIVDLKNHNFLAKDTEINIHKGIFDNSKNDPRMKGVSSEKKGNITTIYKGLFTSCQKNDNCPPWSLKADKIEHDKNKKQLIYQNALLQIYDFPVLYFPKFFHPDPTVKRQSGFLQPKLNNSNILGNSVAIPYFHILSEDSDITFTPTLFDNDQIMVQNEFRKIFKNSYLEADFGHTRNYQSSTENNKKKNISHLFSKFNHNLNLENFISSKLFLSIQKVTNDTYLKVFDGNIINTDLKPNNLNVLKNELKLELDHEDYFFESGIESYESLDKKSSDRYQYILPYYNFDKVVSQNYFNGSISFNSSGNNDLSDTNILKTEIINDINYTGFDIINDYGLKNNLSIYFKNFNAVGKNDSKLKNSPQIELMSTLKIDSSLPLKKGGSEYMNYLTPKLSMLFNPSDMKNHSETKRNINNENIFDINRLGLTDSLETGKSLTLGLEYKKEKLKDINKYFEFKLATVFRDEEENFIPSTSTIGKKTSNLFGSISNNLSDNFNISYNFALNNNLNTFDYNKINSTITLNNLVTEFSFIEEGGAIGSTNTFENKSKYVFDENNSISFKTRRNRKINLTEFYDLVYEYQNDCLTAGIKYNKTYYEDRDLKPTENLLFTITLFPLTSYEQKIN